MSVKLTRTYTHILENTSTHSPVHKSSFLFVCASSCQHAPKADANEWEKKEGNTIFKRRILCIFVLSTKTENVRCRLHHHFEEMCPWCGRLVCRESLVQYDVCVRAAPVSIRSKCNKSKIDWPFFVHCCDCLPIALGWAVCWVPNQLKHAFRSHAKRNGNRFKVGYEIPRTCLVPQPKNFVRFFLGDGDDTHTHRGSHRRSFTMSIANSWTSIIL